MFRTRRAKSAGSTACSVARLGLGPVLTASAEVDDPAFGLFLFLSFDSVTLPLPPFGTPASLSSSLVSSASGLFTKSKL